uniref:Putative ParB-like nuclease n=1 Tax=Klebsiella pneumoniae TaxID=573 RepID=A0A8B0SWC4_KLEPN|nr:putative ParB-like nuclease [Klebsiella pneumoniae]
MALDAAQVEYVPVTALVKSPLNVRTIPYPAEKVCSMADSIEAIGLLQNLVVHNLPDGRCGVAAGGRRLKALQLLQSENRIDAGYQVMVKKRYLMNWLLRHQWQKNEQQMAMHPSEQIAGFRTLAEQGKNPRADWRFTGVRYASCSAHVETDRTGSRNSGGAGEG